MSNVEHTSWSVGTIRCNNSTFSSERTFKSRAFTAIITFSTGISIFRRDIAKVERVRNEWRFIFVFVSAWIIDEIYLPIFRNLVCSRSDTFSGFLNRLLGKLWSPSISLLPLATCPLIPILNRSSKSEKSIWLCKRSSSNSLKIVPRTWLGFRAIQLSVGSLYFVWTCEGT